MKFIYAFINTKSNNEDLALTPYLFYISSKEFKLYGIGICWLHYSHGIAVGFNMPKSLPRFNKFIKKQ